MIEVVEEGKSGFLFTPEMVDDLVEKMEYYINDLDMAVEMGMYSRDLVLKKFNVDLHYERVIEVYNNVLNSLTRWFLFFYEEVFL